MNAGFMPYWESPMVRLYLGDAATVLAQLPAESVDLCCTSPPFWNLRNYRVEGQIGLEPTPELWLEHILAVFQEVRRVLRPWGICWIEIGDSYSANFRGLSETASEMQMSNKGTQAFMGTYTRHPTKPLDLVGIPFRLALALQADGWFLRSVIIWDKPSPMPESLRGWRWVKCRMKIGQMPAKQDSYIGCDALPELRHGLGIPQWADCPGCPKCSPNDGLVLRKGSWRPTEAHSYILMLAKSASYFCNGEAVRERWTDQRPSDIERALEGSPIYGGKNQLPNAQGAVPNIRPVGNPQAGRNLRSVWRIDPEPSSLPHFATFPTGLPEKCILVGTSEWGNCPKCGMPWAPMIQTRDRIFKRELAHVPGNIPTKVDSTDWESPEPIITGWRPTCTCGLPERVPAVVLDPFVGSGTTCVAAQQLSRRSIGIDLSAKYLDMAIKRLEGVPLPLGVGLP